MVKNISKSRKKRKSHSWTPEKEIPEGLDDLVGPLSEIEENEREIIAKFEIPGIKEEDIMINLSKNMIEIKAEKKKEKVVKQKDFYREGKIYTGFYRSLILPEEIVPERSESEYSDGVLILRMPKATRRRIRII